MNYIYDILVNFNKNYFEFYEWNETDDIIHIKKLPILKVNSEFLKDAKKNDVCISKKMLDKIYKKAEFFKGYKTLKLDYVCALTDEKEAIALNITSNGNIIEKSSFLIDEENEIIDISNSMSFCEYDYSVKEKEKEYPFKTRKEISITNYIINELKNIDDDKLKYLYLECFDTTTEDIKLIQEKIKKEIKENFYNVYDKIYPLLKLTSIN
ncbi:MAG: DUF3603 family protein [Bacilli bacterium]|nr:DUF3603 family protein [Bacilli bacterium]